MEFVIGLLIGTVARILMTALDTAGMIIANTSGLANAQVFNPSMAAQGSVVGAFLSVTGVLFIFATNLHHMLIYGLVESYQMFPIGSIPDSGSMADLIARTVSVSFMTGLQMAIPFIVLTLMVNILMGVLSRLMPQLQVFILVLPVQIILTLLVLSLTLSSMYLFWATQFQDGITFFYQSAGK
jgi:flagellar biosynthetic protein FliR